MNRGLRLFYCIILIAGSQLFNAFPAGASEEHNHSVASDSAQSTEDHNKEWHINDMIFNHINDANEYHFFEDVVVPLPCLLYSRTDGFTFFMSSALDHGHKAINGYVLDHGAVRRVKSSDFPAGEVEIGHISHETKEGVEIGFVEYQGQSYELEGPSKIGNSTSFIDFSITKNVALMLITAIFLIWLFVSSANAYKRNPGQAPTGKQNLLEIFINFIIDEVAKPMLGDKYLRFLPFLLTIFFFILALNLFGLIPLSPFGANVTGNITVTMALAVITFILVNINGNGNYWKHMLWMPGLPVPMKIFLAPIEIMGMFIKPISLMIRLFANVTAGHIIIMSLIGLIFIFGNLGQNLVGATAGTAMAVPFTMFMNVIEVIVGLIQAFIFTILSASYLGAATEESHH